MCTALATVKFSFVRQLYMPSEICLRCGLNIMCQTSLRLSVPVAHPGSFILMIDFYTPQQLDVELVTEAERQHGTLKRPTCPYR